MQVFFFYKYITSNSGQIKVKADNKPNHAEDVIANRRGTRSACFANASLCFKYQIRQ